MYYATFLFVLLLQATNFPFHGKNSDVRQIRQVLTTQSEAWNDGDIEQFMQFYWKSPDLQLIGSNGPVYGWQQILERYRAAYPDRQHMGKLAFDILHVNRRSGKVYSVVGKFSLARQDLEDMHGHFLLIFQKIKGQWMIVSDATTTPCHASTSNQ